MKLFQSIACQRNNNAFEKLKKEIGNLNEDIQTLLEYYANGYDYFTKSCDLLFKITVFESGITVESFFADLLTIFIVQWILQIHTLHCQIRLII
ncbi:hypothetical protein ATZ36_10740 [Candidatus Endomicrobiellum trichonymphae]|uniref:Uncharacterized protein n=1 Tax=Endomicrobium trichonymphae TaxID=1408204 RepID=A0A1E5IFK2_ENDTX|nr:hypothetical protein ATZ36_10740 [Candidatus Endomicrobium trichonymphae]